MISPQASHTARVSFFRGRVENLILLSDIAPCCATASRRT